MLSLGLGGILFMTAATYLSSFDRDGYSRQGIWKDAEFDIFYSDSAVELNENGMSGMQAEKPMGDDMVREILAIDGVEKVEELKSLGVSFDFPKHEEYANDDYLYPMSDEEITGIEKYIEEGTWDYDKMMSGDYVLIHGNTNVMEIYGWKFEVGDKVNLQYYDGSRMAEKEVTVLGILNGQYSIDNDQVDGWFVMPEQAVLNQLSYDSLNVDLLISAAPEKEEAVGEALKEMLAERPELSMDTYADRKASYEQTVNTLFGAISGLSVFIMMFSILSMMNTLITNIVTRKQELAMLESIGMTKKQMRRMLLTECFVLVAATVGVTMTIGTGCGYILSSLLCRMGAYYMKFQFPAAFSIAYAAVLIAVPLVITFVSMKSFAKEALVERLRGAEV